MTDEEFYVAVDSVLSLIAHRHTAGRCDARRGLLRRECGGTVVTLPDDVRAEALRLSGEARARYPRAGRQ